MRTGCLDIVVVLAGFTGRVVDGVTVLAGCFAIVVTGVLVLLFVTPDVIGLLLPVTGKTLGFVRSPRGVILGLPCVALPCALLPRAPLLTVPFRWCDSGRA